MECVGRVIAPLLPYSTPYYRIVPLLPYLPLDGCAGLCSALVTFVFALSAGLVYCWGALRAVVHSRH